MQGKKEMSGLKDNIFVIVNITVKIVKVVHKLQEEHF